MAKISKDNAQINSVFERFQLANGDVIYYNPKRSYISIKGDQKGWGGLTVTLPLMDGSSEIVKGLYFCHDADNLIKDLKK